MEDLDEAYGLQHARGRRTFSAGCARGPAVSADGLALRRVVIYRNGVGYFERAGHIKTDRVDFKVRGDEVRGLPGDPRGHRAGRELGSFGIVPHQGRRKGNRRLRSRSKRTTASRTKRLRRPKKPKKKKKEPEPNAMETVVLELDGKAHDLQVGYVAATPVWRPSYRLVVEKGGTSDLQAWGIVQIFRAKTGRG